MGQQRKPDVEVTISPELRAIFSNRKRAAQDGSRHPKQKVVVPHENSISENCRTPVWQWQTLRRDGGRPLKFEGLKVVEHEPPVPLAVSTFEQRMAIYIDRSRNVYMSLALVVPPDAGMRSVFDADQISAQAPTHLLSKWYEKVVRVTGLLTACSSHDDMRGSIHHAARSITPQ